MADLMSILQANAAPPPMSQGWASVGQALAGLSGAGREQAYDRGMARAAQLDQLVQTARLSREKAMEAERAREKQAGLAEELIAAGWDPGSARVAGAFAGSNLNPNEYATARLSGQEYGNREGIVTQALQGNLPAAGAYSMGLAKGPLEMTKIQGNTTFNPYEQPDQQTYATDVGRSEIAKNGAQAQTDMIRAYKSGSGGGGGGEGGGKAPSGYRYLPSGDLEPIPGGPADKPRDGGGKALNAPTINKLAGDADKLANLDGLVNTFQDSFAGNKVGGNAENLMGRLGLPGATPGQSDWWQKYDRQKNVVRNELFGAALTPSEQAEFDKADINANMAPATIKKNLAAQQAVIQRALKRQARTWAAQGYSADALREATGMDDFSDNTTATPPSPAGWGIRKVK
ncbi:hypothetical protein [Stenotrophomonas sp. AS1]|uniref:hypothetical protein n=1 Tax=Stenotrophomonas sp. AS1 TaxID=3029188 RepID=UPI003B828D24